MNPEIIRFTLNRTIDIRVGYEGSDISVEQLDLCCNLIRRSALGQKVQNFLLKRGGLKVKLLDMTIYFSRYKG